MRKEELPFLMAAVIMLSAFLACQPPGGTDLFAGIARRDMVSISGGTFFQTYNGTNGFNHTVSNFSMGKYEVTYELWYAVCQWALSHGYTFANAGREGNDGAIGAASTTGNYEPVTTISWRDAIVWCNAYSQMTGLAPCYTYASAVIKDSRDTNGVACNNAVCNWSANGYRLPTEGEWQYAASNKGNTPYNYASGATADYANATATGLIAWYEANSGSSTKNVGTTTNSSALTLCDVSGNIGEWCWDWHGTYPGATTDHRGPASGASRMTRGGSWGFGASYLQVGFRVSYNPYYEDGWIGFRLARTFIL